MGYKLILVFSEVDSPVAGLVSENVGLGNDSKSIYHDGSFNDTAALTITISSIENSISDSKSTLLAVLAGAETGVELADALSFKMLCRSNGIKDSEIRRKLVCVCVIVCCVFVCVL